MEIDYEQRNKDLKDRFEKELEGIKDLTELEDVRVAYLGKKGSVTDLLKAMKDLSNEDKKAFGQKINELKGSVANRIAEKTEEMKKAEIQRPDSIYRFMIIILAKNETFRVCQAANRSRRHWHCHWDCQTLFNNKQAACKLTQCL